MSPIDVHSILTGHCTIIKGIETNLSGAMIIDLVATHPTNKMMGHVVAHVEENSLVLSKPFRLGEPDPIPVTHENYVIVVNDRPSFKN
ncbi:hypothetical protein [Sulfitobacter sp. R18_1]|uniref:hypothetical protein n=1 Tax=Sulfitobacter sp. R18_1 TaxID=2821104 RepID=UPI001ADA3461|nr:hypothetical protein [Sulfitobacter sp. R18_1]MBO9428373.1 hypothetical protein [Sulfitobacter sp. R18_1]